MLHEGRPKQLKNINSDFYEYLYIQTDNNKLDIPEILLRTISLLNILSPIIPILFEPFIHNRTKQEQSNEHKKALRRKGNIVSKIQVKNFLKLLLKPK